MRNLNRLMNYTRVEEAYYDDVVIANLVDQMVIVLRDLEISPAELRSIAVFAAIKFEREKLPNI